MASVIAWLDTSADEQRRARELIAMFAQSESRDELGIGQIRDAFSNTLFPGTSVIQTRARYFLFVPWIYRAGLSRRLTGQALKSWANTQERKLVATLADTGATDGLIGRVAGAAVKQLPSTIYWSGLIRYGILTRDIAADQLTGVTGDTGVTGATAAVEADELAFRAYGEWNPTLPTAPQGFPESVPNGFGLLHNEALWLAEQFEKAAPETLLAHLLTAESGPDQASPAPWEDTVCVTAPSAVADQLTHAQLFSLCIHGAALLYNLLIGERYERQGLNAIEHPVDTYRERLRVWADHCVDARPQLATWDRHDMWDLVTIANPRVGLVTKLFVDTWIDAIMAGHYAGIADNAALRAVVGERERRQKGAQSRLNNDRLLRTWSGAAGSERLVFRWPQVRRIVTDVREGAHV
jgi:hypothetical protein